MSDTTTLVPDLVENISEQFPVHRGFLQQAVAGATDQEVRQLTGYLEFCMGKDLTLDYLAECYLTILGDTIDEQMYFRDNGHYRHSTFDEVAASVYHDRDYMDRYMYGLAITNFLWPNHVGMARFLRESLPRDRGGRYLEVGPGHGFLLLSAIEVGGFDELLARRPLGRQRRADPDDRRPLPPGRPGSRRGARLPRGQRPGARLVRRHRDG